MSQPSFDELYQSFASRESRFNGLWWVGVKTTGVFCRPQCPSRTPLAKNVLFFDAIQKAEEAGFRACKRCKPKDVADSIPEDLAQLHAEIMAKSGLRISDWELQQRGMNPVAVRRGFLKHYGVTFHQLQRSSRVAMALDALRQGAGAMEAGLSAGYDSSSAFRKRFQELLGTAPSQAGAVSEARLQSIETPLGPMIAIAVEDQLALLEFADRKSIEGQLKRFRAYFDRPLIQGPHPVLQQTQEQLQQYFAGERTAFDLPLARPGTEFQQAVWALLDQIPYGQTRSYNDLAAALEKPGASRAVGKANGDNRLAIIVPCHRVIRSDGHLCGYAGGLWRKKWLLAHESGHPQSLFDEPTYQPDPEIS